METLTQPWPWWAAGICIGLTVPLLLLLGNKHFGVSGNLRHICAACIPANIKFFRYDWRKESWNLFFIGGALVGGAIASVWLKDPASVQVHPDLIGDLAAVGVTRMEGLVPPDLFSWSSLFTPRGFVLMVVGGFLVGFGTRYAGGCTSGHAIMGLSTLQWPSLVATVCFMIGGFLMTNLLLPYLLAL
ncbi:MAG: YeeE/YedE family protein [Saprospiraceae bacterium]